MEEDKTMAYRHIVFTNDYELFYAEGMKPLLRALKAAGYKLGMIVTEITEEINKDDSFWEMYHGFDCILPECECECGERELDGVLLNMYMRRFKVIDREVLYIGSGMYDMESASIAGVDCGLALWRCERPRHTWATYYFAQPYDVWSQLKKNMEPFAGKEWISMAMELQFLAQSGLAYSRDVFDKERFEQVRDISARIMALGSGLPIRLVKDVFCNETGYQTPKVDCRGVIFHEDKILLVKESNGLWSLPGGWVDVNQSVGNNTVKEVKEEAGLDVVPIRLIALLDRNLHNKPVYGYGICKAFVQCEVISGKFEKNKETIDCRYFSLDELPPLALNKTTAGQVEMCFDAYQKENWDAVLD